MGSFEPTFSYKKGSSLFCITIIVLTNRYGHPGEKTMDRLKRMNTDIYVTMSTGQINIISRKNGFVVETFLD